MYNIIEKIMILFCIVLGSILTYLSGHDIYWSAGIVPFVSYTVGVMITWAGIRAVLKS